MELLTSKT